MPDSAFALPEMLGTAVCTDEAALVLNESTNPNSVGKGVTFVSAVAVKVEPLSDDVGVRDSVNLLAVNDWSIGCGCPWLA